MLADATRAAILRAAIYLRLSYLEGDSFGLDVQEDIARTYCEAHGYTIVATYRDENADSAELERPELDALRDALHRHEFDVLVFPRLDRMARNQKLFGFLMFEAELHGVTVKFADPNEQFNDDALGDLLRNITAWKAQADRERIRDNTQRGRHKRAEHGQPIPGRFCPYGYQWFDRKKTKAVERPDTAQRLRWLYEQVDAGVPLRQITDELNAGQVPTPSGKAGGRWDPANIRRILRSRIYISEYQAYHIEVIRRREYFPNGKSKKIVRNRPRGTDDPKLVPLPDVFPPLVERDLFDRVQDRLERNARESTRHNTNPEATLLRSGFVVCGTCGHPMTVARVTLRSGETRYNYICSHRKPRNGKPCPAQASIRAEALDKRVWALTVTALTSSRARTLFEQGKAWAEQQRRAEATAERDLSTLAHDLTKTEKQIAIRTAELAGEDNPDLRAILKHQLTDLIERKKQITIWQEEAKKRAEIASERDARFEQTMEWARGMVSRLLRGDLSYAERRDILNDLDTIVVVWPDEHLPRWMLLFGWSGYLLERMSNPQAVPLPVDCELEEFRQELARQMMPAVKRWFAEHPATEEELARMREVVGRTAKPAEPVTEEVRLDPERLRLALAPAANWATDWLFRPKGGRTIEGRTRHNTRMCARI